MKKGVINKSRREANFTKMLKPEERELYIKQFIAACEAKELIPFIKITKHDPNFREIEYEIVIPSSDN